MWSIIGILFLLYIFFGRDSNDDNFCYDNDDLFDSDDEIINPDEYSFSRDIMIDDELDFNDW